MTPGPGRRAARLFLAAVTPVLPALLILPAWLMLPALRVLPALLVVSATPAAAQAGPPPAKIEACAACHGKDGNAPIPATPSLAGQPALFLENQLVMIREGLRPIPQMTGLLDRITDEEIVAIAAHYARQSPKASPAGARDDARMARGKERADALHCGSCHLPDYRGRDQVPRLVGQREDYLLLSLRQFRNNEAVGRDTIMAATLHGVSAEDLEAMAHYLAHLTP